MDDFTTPAYDSLSKINATEAWNQILEVVEDKNKEKVRKLLDLIVTEMTRNATHKLWK